MALGESFSPITAQQEQNDPRLRKRRTPVQQALQTMQLAMPAYTGQNALTGRLLAGQSGAGAAQAAQGAGKGTPGLQTMLNALTGAGTSSSSGFAGGGFGAGGPVASAGGATTRPSKPAGGGAPKPGAGAAPGVGPGGGPKPPGGGGPKLPGLPGNIPGKVQGAISGIKAALPPGGFKLPSGLKPPKKPSFEAPEPGDKNWMPQPNIPGMGLLEPPKMPSLPAAPPVSFGGGGPKFTTPTGGAGGGFGGGPVSGGAPGNVPYAPQSQPAAPAPAQGTWVKNPQGYGYFIPGLTGSAQGVAGTANQRPPGY
jgi:hypothetical protein